MQRVPNFQHTAGNHCGSTAMRDLLHHAGLPLSEAMCFGLGSGLSFHYFPDTTAGTATHFFHGRGGTLERDLCIHLALAFAQGTDDDDAHAWQAARAWVDAGTPVLLYVELRDLPYYNTRTPFPGHRVVLAGYDAERELGLLADNAFAELQPVTLAALRQARHSLSTSALFPLRNDWLVVQPTPQPTPLAEAIRIALRANARALLEPDAPLQGVAAMRWLAEDFSAWGDASDWEWCARLAYQLIEKRGTGGGMFRKMYAAYLREAEMLVPALRAARLAETLAEIADAWTGLAMILKRISEDKERAGFAEAGRALAQLGAREEDFWTTIKNLPGL